MSKPTRPSARKPERRPKRGTAEAKPESLTFTRVNAGLAVVGLATLSIGYWLLAQGSITAAPLLLVLAYVVLLPLAIIR